jgi:hypothetical protein
MRAGASSRPGAAVRADSRAFAGAEVCRRLHLTPLSLSGRDRSCNRADTARRLRRQGRSSLSSSSPRSLSGRARSCRPAGRSRCPRLRGRASPFSSCLQSGACGAGASFAIGIDPGARSGADVGARRHALSRSAMTGASGARAAVGAEPGAFAGTDVGGRLHRLLLVAGAPGGCSRRGRRGGRLYRCNAGRGVGVTSLGRREMEEGRADRERDGSCAAAGPRTSARPRRMAGVTARRCRRCAGRGRRGCGCGPSSWASRAWMAALGRGRVRAAQPSAVGVHLAAGARADVGGLLHWS